MDNKISGITRHSATTLLISLIFSIITPTIMHHTSVAGFSTGIHEKVDVFRGGFSQQIFNVAVGQIFEVPFEMTPVLDVSNVVVHIITPGDLVRPIQASEISVGNVEKGTTVPLIFPMIAEHEVDTYITVKIEESGVAVPCSSSYEFRVTTLHAQQTQVGPDSEEPSESLEPTSPGTITIKGTLKYYDEDGVLSPVRRIAVFLKDDDTGFDEDVASQWTDNSGKFSFTVNNDDGWLQDGRDPYIKIESQNPWAKIRPGVWKIYYWELPKAGNDVPDGFYHDYGTLILGGANGRVACQIMNSVIDQVYWIWARVSWQRSQINIYYPSDGPKFEWGPFTEHIDLPATRHDHTTVWHEYGHAVMYTLYGDDMPSGSGPSPHNPTSESSGGFALAEGWAEFMQCVIDNNPNNLWWAGQNIETNDWYNHQDSGDMDGNIVEGSAASILWDIFDAKSTTDQDDMAWGFEEIFHVIRYDNPGSMISFWSRWIARWPSLSTSKGPLSTIYWHYGINRDYYNPYGGYVIINGGAGTTTSTSVSLTLFCKDWGSGPYGVRLSYPDGSWSGWYYYGTSAGWSIAAGDGYKYVYAQYMDRVGRLSPVYSDYIFLDTTKPAGSIVINYLNPTYTPSTSVTLYLTYSDAGSGVDKVRYANSGGSWTGWLSPSPTKAWTLTSGDGLKRVWYQVRDRAGWIQQYYDDIILDTVWPTGSILINGGAATTTTTSVTLTLTYSDAGSGVDKVRYANSGGSWTGWLSPSPTKAWTLTSGDGLKRVYYQIRDKAGWIRQYYDDIQLKTAAINTQVFFNFNPNPVQKGTTVELEGILVDVKSNPIASALVKVTYSTNDGGSWHVFTRLTTNMYGEFSKTFTAPAVGTFLVEVSYAGSATYNPSRSTTYLRILATAPPATESSIYFNFFPNPVKSGTTVQLKGILTILGDPIAGASVKIEYSLNNGATWATFTTLTTNEYGIFSISFTAPGPGTYLVRVSSGTLSVTTYIKITS